MTVQGIVYVMIFTMISFVILIIILMYWNYRRYKRLCEETRKAMEMITGHIDKKYDLKFGRMYLYIDFGYINFGQRAFVTLTKLGFLGMLIHSKRRYIDLKSLEPVARKNIKKEILLIREHSGEGYVNPTKLETLLDEILEFQSIVSHKGAEGIIMIHGLEYIISENGISRTREFLSRLKTCLNSSKSVMVFISLNPQGVDKGFLRWLRGITTNGNVFWVDDADLKTIAPFKKR